MNRIELDEKTGFQNLSKKEPIVIYDNRNIPFYDSRFIKKPVDYFNLPAGKFKILSGNFIPLSKPREFKKFNLPKAERNKPFPGDFEVLFAPNPHKALIDWDNKRIIFDTQFKTKPLPELMFIFFHEIGHHKWGGHMPGSSKYDEAEHNCDMYSHNMMIDEGYNPSQIGLAPIETLSFKQQIRKKKLINKMLK